MCGCISEGMVDTTQNFVNGLAKEVLSERGQEIVRLALEILEQLIPVITSAVVKVKEARELNQVYEETNEVSHLLSSLPEEDKEAAVRHKSAWVELLESHHGKKVVREKHGSLKLNFQEAIKEVGRVESAQLDYVAVDGQDKGLSKRVGAMLKKGSYLEKGKVVSQKRLEKPLQEEGVHVVGAFQPDLSCVGAAYGVICSIPGREGSEEEALIVTHCVHDLGHGEEEVSQNLMEELLHSAKAKHPELMHVLVSHRVWSEPGEGAKKMFPLGEKYQAYSYGGQGVQATEQQVDDALRRRERELKGSTWSRVQWAAQEAFGTGVSKIKGSVDRKNPFLTPETLPEPTPQPQPAF